MEFLKNVSNKVSEKVGALGNLRVSFKGEGSVRLYEKDSESSIAKFDAAESGKTFKLTDILLVVGIASAVGCVISLIDDIFN